MKKEGKIIVCIRCGKGGENGPLIKEIIGYPFFPHETGEYIHEKCVSN